MERSAGGLEAMTDGRSGVVASGAVFGWVHERVLPDGRWRVAPEPLLEQLATHLEALSTTPADSLVLVPHRQLRTMNSQLRDITAPGSRRESVAVLVHPSTARAVGPDGCRVEVRSPWGSLTGTLRADDRLHPSAVAVAHGWGECNVSALTSADDGIDPLTGMVLQSGVPVTLRHVAGYGGAGER